MKRTIYYISHVFSWVFLSLFIFLLIFSLLGFLEYYLGWDIPFVKHKNLDSESAIYVTLPLLNVSLSFPPNGIVIIPIVIFGFYSLYFFQLTRFFKIFIAKSLFSSESVMALKKFLWYNLIIVIVALVAFTILWIRESFKMDESLLILIVHLIVSFLVYLYLDMASKGSELQQENDLTI